MDNRKIACGVAAVFLGVALAASSTNAFAKAPIVVVAPRADSELQRTVSYADLNLAARPDQRVLSRRIQTTADNLCFDLNGNNQLSECIRYAVHSTDDQVAAAIDRAERQMAGLPVGPAIAISMVIGAQ